MPPFNNHALITGFKERVESITHYSDRLYLGTSTGNLHIYGITKDDDGVVQAAFEDCKKGVSRRAIEQLGFTKDVNSLVVLADGAVTLFPSPTFNPPTLLTQAKGAMSFGIDSSIQYSLDGPESPSKGAAAGVNQGIPSVITRLAVGCKRKLVIYTWKDGEAQEVREINLPHSPRSVTFSTPNIIVLSYTNTDHVLIKLPLMSVTDLTLPAPAPTPSAGIGGMGRGAFSGLGGYMTLGLGAKAKPAVYRVNDDGEFAVLKDASTSFFNSEGQINRSGGLDWSGPPDETAFVKPYMVSILPAGTVPLANATKPAVPAAGAAAPPPPATYAVPCVQIVSSLSLSVVQTVPFPFGSSTSDPSTASKDANPVPATSVRLLTPSPAAKSPLFLTSTPVDRTAAAAEGTSIWTFSMESWGEQLDELVDAGSYADALALLNTLDKTSLPDLDERRSHIEGLHAVHVFSQGKYIEAIKTFIDLDINPAKVVALYPESIAGRLSTPRSKWIELFGGKTPKAAASPEVTGSPNAPTQSTGAVIAGQLRSTLEALVPSIPDGIPNFGLGDDDVKSIQSLQSAVKSKGPVKDEYTKSIEQLLVYLGDRRPKLSGALQTFNITPAKSPEMPTLSETSIDQLFALPNQPPPALIPEQLLRYAQIVDTALFKSYLVVRPSLVGSLCRLDNWCEVAEVEEVLRERKKFSELIDLYKGKKMHDKALLLLKELSADENDPIEKVDPTALYLQKLGPEHLTLVFSWANWVIEQSPNRGLKIFMSDDVELPRKDVASYLAGKDLDLCARYLEFLMEEKQETAPLYHNWLAETYLDMTTAAKRKKNETAEVAVYNRLLKFIRTSTHYEVDRIFAHLPADNYFEARAILLGRLGKHEAALDIYVNRLYNYVAAEDYCKQVYQTDPNPQGIFLTLLRIYLRPSASGTKPSLEPALDLISRHSPRLDSVEALQLLPPLVNTSELRTFLTEALKAPKVDSRITKELWKARSVQVDRKLIGLQSRRVKVTDSRICPQCHKRLGNSVIAVHSPRGEVTHYQCREAFVQRLPDATPK